MTREEEIKARLDGVKAIDFRGCWTMDAVVNLFINNASSDMLYLLARNEELQCEKEKRQAVVDAARNLKLTILAKRKPEDYVHTFAMCDKTNALVAALQVIDAKEQDDE